MNTGWSVFFSSARYTKFYPRPVRRLRVLRRRNFDRKEIYTRQNCTLLPMPCIDIPAELAMNPSEHFVVTVLRKRRRKIGLVSKMHDGHDVSLPGCSSTDPRFERNRISRLTISWTPFVDRRFITCSVAKFR